LRGISCGDAAIGEKDGNSLVNKGAATARDMFELIEIVRKKAREQCGVELDLALEVWG
jgi:UDP-N-acetylmuramate dehydrogenase